LISEVPAIAHNKWKKLVQAGWETIKKLKDSVTGSEGVL